MLDIDSVVVAYGKKKVLHGVSLAVQPAQIVSLVGHNGAGKTTLIRAALGLVARISGSVMFDGAPVEPHQVAKTVARGIAYVPQSQNTFRSLTVADNLAIAVGAAGEGADSRVELVYEMFPILRERRASQALKLSGGQQQMLALAIALLRNPRLIMLDEPSTGLAPVLVDEVFRHVVEMRDRLGMSVLIVDQNVRRLLQFTDRLSVLKAGRIVFAGPPSEVGSDEALWSLF